MPPAEAKHKQNAHCDGRRAQLSNDFTKDVKLVNTKVSSFTSEPTQNSSRRVSSFKDSSALLNILSGELHKSESLLIASTLLVVKAENIYRNTSKMDITMKAELSKARLHGEEQSF